MDPLTLVYYGYLQDSRTGFSASGCKLIMVECIIYALECTILPTFRLFATWSVKRKVAIDFKLSIYYKLSLTVLKLSKALSIFSIISPISISGSGRFSKSIKLSSLSQKISKFVLSLSIISL